MNKNGTVFKSSGVEWVGDVPEHWQVCKLKRLSPVKRGASPRPIVRPQKTLVATDRCALSHRSMYQ